MAVSQPTAAALELVRHDGLRLALPECKKGIGAIILAPDSANLIEGVRIQPFALWPDDRGYFLEVMRTGQGLVTHYDLSHTQVSAALSYPETIKAFHYHLQQFDCWAAVSGMLQVALVDLRGGSATFGMRNTMYVGSLRPWQILVPPGVAHGYKVIGPNPAMLVYVTDQYYNPRDEGRVPYNDSHIAYDWEFQYK